MEKGREGMVKGEEVRQKSRGEVKEEIVLPLDLNTGYGSEMKHLGETSSYQKTQIQHDGRRQNAYLRHATCRYLPAAGAL